MIYLVQVTDTDLYKIGYTSNLEKRLYSLRGSCPYPLLLVRVWSIPSVFEYLLHEKFNEYRKHGEWFSLPNEVAIKLGECEKLIDIVQKFDLQNVRGFVDTTDLMDIPL